MERGNLPEKMTVVGSGGSLVGGTTTMLTGLVAGALGVTLAPPVLPLFGLGGFIVGALGAYFLEDKILKRAEEDARLIRRESRTA